MKVIKSEINDMFSSAWRVLATDSVEARELCTALDNFISELETGTKLKGAVYDTFKARLESYRDLMEKRHSIAVSTRDAIATALSNMRNYIGDEPELDDSILPDINHDINLTNNVITNSKNQLNEIGLTEEEKKNINNTISSYSNTLQELEKKRQKLEGLAAADEAAWASLAETSSTLENFSTSVASTIV